MLLMARAPLLLAAAAVLAGCYKYEPLSSATPARGQDVQVSLNGDGATQVKPHFGQDVTLLQARVLEVRTDSMSLAVHSAFTSTGVQAYTGADTLALPLSAVTSIAGRKLSVGQSALLGGVLLGGSIGAVAALSGDGGNGTLPPGGGNNPQ
jgi:hypothetical protein